MSLGWWVLVKGVTSERLLKAAGYVDESSGNEARRGLHVVSYCCICIIWYGISHQVVVSMYIYRLFCSFWRKKLGHPQMNSCQVCFHQKYVPIVVFTLQDHWIHLAQSEDSLRFSLLRYCGQEPQVRCPEAGWMINAWLILDDCMSCMSNIWFFRFDINPEFSAFFGHPIF